MPTAENTSGDSAILSVPSGTVLSATDFSEESAGSFMHALAQQLWRYPRSLTGNGVRSTLADIAELLPDLSIHEVPSGTAVFDWVVPDEWNIHEAYILGPSGERIADFQVNNVHLVSYSTPVEFELDLAELQEHLHSIPDYPNAIPYVTSYYNRTWGFCLTHRERESLQPGTYRVVIKGTLEPGSMTYGELVIPGKSEKEVFISTYVCHPSLANNELSGPVVSVALALWLSQQKDRHFTYRFVFVPETIGAVAYSAHNLKHLHEHVVAGFNLTCIGDEGDYSYLASRPGNLPIDRIAQRVVRTFPQSVEYSYVDRGSDERQYGAPGIDLPLISLMRTRYGKYPEYHTSLDDLTVVTPTGLQGGFDLVRSCIQELENSRYFRTPVLGEPQLGKRGLYHAQHGRTVAEDVLLRTHILAYADGNYSVQDMVELFEQPQNVIEELIVELKEHGLLTENYLGE